MRKLGSQGGRVRGGPLVVKRSVNVLELLEEHPELEELTWECHFNVSDYDPGRTDGPPEDCYPPEGGDIEPRIDRTMEAFAQAIANWSHAVGMLLGSRCAALSLEPPDLKAVPADDPDGTDPNYWEVD